MTVSPTLLDFLQPHYDDLRTLPYLTKGKMWLNHYQDNPQQVPTADGFAGFIQPGQEFEL